MALVLGAPQTEMVPRCCGGAQTLSVEAVTAPCNPLRSGELFHSTCRHSQSLVFFSSSSSLFSCRLRRTSPFVREDFIGSILSEFPTQDCAAFPHSHDAAGYQCSQR